MSLDYYPYVPHHNENFTLRRPYVLLICEGGFNPDVQEYAKRIQNEFVDNGLDVIIRSTIGHPPIAIDVHTLPLVLNGSHADYNLLLNLQSIIPPSCVELPNYKMISIPLVLNQIKEKWKDYVFYHHIPNDLSTDIQGLIRTLTSLYQPQKSIEGFRQRLQNGSVDMQFQNSIIQLHRDYKSAYNKLLHQVVVPEINYIPQYGKGHVITDLNYAPPPFIVTQIISPATQFTLIDYLQKLIAEIESIHKDFPVWNSYISNNKLIPTTNWTCQFCNNTCYPNTLICSNCHQAKEEVEMTSFPRMSPIPIPIKSESTMPVSGTDTKLKLNPSAKEFVPHVSQYKSPPPPPQQQQQPMLWSETPEMWSYGVLYNRNSFPRAPSYKPVDVTPIRNGMIKNTISLSDYTQKEYSNNIEHPCEVCGLESTLACHECLSSPPYKNTYYCSTKHQKENWGTHQAYHKAMQEKYLS